jgi:DNA topoisomerase VI subunit B
VSQVLERVTFATPRDSGYTKIPVLEKLAGQPVREFAHVVLKELVDNGLDAAEDAGIAPEIEVRVTPAGDGAVQLTVADNGLGIPGSKVAGFCDFTMSTSDKTGYVSPARGAQGNAWPCIISIPFALGIRPGTIVIGTQGIRHLITPEMVLGERLTINHVPEPWAAFASGTVVSVPLPASLELDISRWVSAYATVNPHATFSVILTAADGEETRELYKPAVQDGWRKWLPSRPTSPHWYDQDNLRDLISALLAAGEDKPLGGFIREFDGLTSTAKARKLAAMVPGSVNSLSGVQATAGRHRRAAGRHENADPAGQACGAGRGTRRPLQGDDRPPVRHLAGPGLA